MATQVEETKEQQKPAAEGKPAAAEKPAAETAKPAAEGKPAAAEKPEKEKPGKVAEAKVESAAIRRVTVKDDDEEIPDDADLVELSMRGLKNRLTRHTKRQLKERFGTDDIEAIAKDLDELKTFRTEKEERRKKELSEKERLEEEKRALEERAAKAEKRAQMVEADRRFEKEDTGLRDVAQDLIKPKFWKHVRTDFADYVLETFDEKELKALDANSKEKNKVLKKWLADYLKENPEYAKVEDKAEKKEGAPITNGADTNERPDKAKSTGDNPASGGKSMRPNQPNSMSPIEARQTAAKDGYHW